MNEQQRVFVAGSNKSIGAALLRLLKSRSNVALVNEEATEPDLTNAEHVDQFFQRTRPDLVYLAAGKCGGIVANQCFPADFMRDNLLIQCHVLQSAHRCGVKKLLFLASSCVYPSSAATPFHPQALLTDSLEPSSEPYALAKLAGIKLCQSYRRQYRARFISGILADVFGPEDEFYPTHSHVVAGLIRRMHEAKESCASQFVVWGTGQQRREFAFADDLAEACCLVMEKYDSEDPINIGPGTTTSIAELAKMIQEIVGFRGELIFDSSKPQGAACKLLDSSTLYGLGWRPKTALRDAIASVYRSYLHRLNLDVARS